MSQDKQSTYLDLSLTARTLTDAALVTYWKCNDSDAVTDFHAQRVADAVQAMERSIAGYHDTHSTAPAVTPDPGAAAGLLLATMHAGNASRLLRRLADVFERESHESFTGAEVAALPRTNAEPLTTTIAEAAADHGPLKCNCESSYCDHHKIEAGESCPNQTNGTIQMYGVGTVCDQCAKVAESHGGANLIDR